MAGETAPQPITASARRIDLTSKVSTKLIGKTPSKLMDEAWDYYDLVPEAKFGANFLGNAMSRIRLFPGIVVSDDEPPVSIMDAAGSAGGDTRATPIVEGLTDQIAEAARDELARVRNRRTGQAGLMREFGVSLTVCGDTYLIADDVDVEDRDAADVDGEDLEDWNVYAASSLKRVGDPRDGDTGVRLLLERGQRTGTKLGPDALLYRIWQRHSRWPSQADSNMFAVADTCEELLIYSRKMRAVGKSGIPNGMLFFPSEMDFPDHVTTVDGAEVRIDGWTYFVQQVVEGLIAPSEDDGHPGSVAPYFAKVKGEFIAQIKHLTFQRLIDAAELARLEYLIGRLAHGMDMPPEVLTGLGDVKFRNAVAIEDSTYKAHVEPKAMIPAAGIGSAFLRPAVMERSLGEGGAGGFALPPEVLRRICVGLDPSSLVVRPNRAQDAKDAFDKLGLSWAALRRYLAFSDDDAPSEDELLQRLTYMRGVGGVDLTRDLLHVVIPGAVPTAEQAAETTANASTDDGSAPPPDNADETDVQTEPDNGDATASARARLRGLAPPAPNGNGHGRVAAATGPELGARLAQIDARLRDRLAVAASDAMTDALRVAGSRLRSAAQGTDHAEAVRGVDADTVGSTLGGDVVAQIADIDTLLAGAFAVLEQRWSAWVTAAQADAVRIVGESIDDPAQRSAAVTEMTAHQDDDRDAGWLLLFAALTVIARARVTQPGFGIDTTGETDPTITVPISELRTALARAGGALEPAGVPELVGASVDMGASGGVATGPRVMRGLNLASRKVVAWEWTVGFPTVPFEPHQRLSGVRFTSWDDVQLTNGGGFPAHSFYFPGDHKGCVCDAVPVVVDAAELVTR